MSDKMPPLPDLSYLGDDAIYGYEASDMHAYARTYAAEQTRELVVVVQELFSLEDTLLRDIYGSDFVAAAREALAKHKASNE